MAGRATDSAVMFRRLFIAALTLLALSAFPSPARADITAFFGGTTTPTTRSAKGFAVGVSLLVIGFEYEYSHTSQDEPNAAPELKSHMGNVLLQTPTGGVQLYFTIGGGFYQETYRTFEDSGFGSNLGGGVKITLVGPLRFRGDYRVFNLHGNPLYPHPKRFYGGVVLSF